MIRRKRRSGRPVWRWLSYGVGVLVVMLAILILVGMGNAPSKPVVRQLRCTGSRHSSFEPKSQLPRSYKEIMLDLYPRPVPEL